jgi:phosphoribosylformylglycinamidine cyclo-ligase
VKTGGVTIKACSHITGGGFYENIPRMLCEGTHAVIYKDRYTVPAVFNMLSVDGSIEEKIMYNTFNMGIGMMIAVDSADADKTLGLLKSAGETAYILGEIKAGEKGVTLC